MSTVIESRPAEATEDEAPTGGLFQVWIDLNFGGEFGPPDWWWNSPPKPLRGALEEAAEARAGGWTCRVLPESMNPREDGRWDNPI